MEGYWIVRTYEAGNVGEKTKFWVPGARPSSQSARRLRDAVKKQAQNEYSAEKALARLINANFTAGDLLLGLDYSDAGAERLERWARAQGLPMESEEDRMESLRAAAERELRLVLRRVKRALAAEGIPLRYIAVTSDMDGDTGEAVRVHHHLLIGREAGEAFREKWAGMGGVDWTSLSRQPDYTPVAAYLLRQVRRVPDHKKFFSSRNLVRPQPRDRLAPSGAELRVPKGGVLIFRGEFRPGAPQYIRYLLPFERRRAPAGAQRSGSGGKRTSKETEISGLEVNCRKAARETPLEACEDDDLQGLSGKQNRRRRSGRHAGA